MKRLYGFLTGIILILAVAQVASAQANIGFAWDYGAPMPSGFEMTITPTSGAPIINDCGAAATKTCTVIGVPSGSYSAFCRAYQVGVPATLKSYSDPSNSITFTIPVKPAAPTNNRLGAVQMTLNLTWPANDNLVADVTVSHVDKSQ